MSIDIPISLVRAIESGRCVLFLGAGIGQHLITHGQPLPNGKALARELCAKFDITESEDLPLVARAVELDKGRKDLEAFISKRFSDAQPDETLQWLISLRWKSIYTTNYDEGIKRAFELNGDVNREPIIYSLSRDIMNYDGRINLPVIHLHGALYGAHKTALIITSEDFITYKEKRRMLFDLLKVDAASTTILYVGYSNKDPNWNVLIKELRDDFFPAKLPPSFRIDPYTEELESKVLQADGLTTIKTDLETFVATLKTKLSTEIAEDSFQHYKEGIPVDFHASFEQNPAATLRIFNHWTYVNQANLDKGSNLKSFLKGDRPEWSLIGKGEYFERDIEENIYDDCLDYITSPTKKLTSISIFSPAGYGTTTLLMTLAVKIAEQKAASVFYLNETAELNEGDVEFALDTAKKSCIFIIDNASRYKHRIYELLHRFRELKKPLLIIVGSRRNEWQQKSHNGIGGKEYTIDQLSEDEIQKLLVFLKKNSSLGVLENLSSELQIAAIKNNLGKELLVTMREATEGKAFDGIIEDEYRNISHVGAQKIYLTVSCFYQYGSVMRTGLLAQLCGINEAKLHPILNKYLDGVIIHEDINASMGIYGLRPRHRKIAEIVWERCGDRMERENILQEAIEKLNLTYQSDRDAFDSFIQEDRLIDTISTLDGKIKFFETAIRKDPHNPYIFQHSARMFSREKKYDLALGQIERALEIEPNKRILHHTKGEVLAELAITVPSIDIARKRLAQSEASFRTGLKLRSNDEYCIHGIASLYFKWARRVTDPDESSEYLAKAETEITEGLKIASYKERLWILSAEISNYVGDSPNHIRALTQAVSSTSGASLSRYLLGRAFRLQGKYPEALEILMPALKDNPDNFRLAIECAECYLGTGKTYAEAISLLNLANLHGMKNARYAAILYGLYFLEGNYSHADKIRENSQQNLSLEERRAPYFYPMSKRDPHKPMSISGKVSISRQGYALIEVPGYPRDFICPGSKWGNMVLKPQMTVTCDLVFNAEGALAVNPREDNLLI